MRFVFPRFPGLSFFLGCVRCLFQRQREYRGGRHRENPIGHRAWTTAAGAVAGEAHHDQSDPLFDRHARNFIGWMAVGDTRFDDNAATVFGCQPRQPFACLIDPHALVRFDSVMQPAVRSHLCDDVDDEKRSVESSSQFGCHAELPFPKTG